MFKVNEKVFYPAQGVAQIAELIEKSVSGTTLKLYKLNFIYKDMTVMVPVNNIEPTGVRPLSPKSEIEQELQALKDRLLDPNNNGDLNATGWNKRQKDYQLRLQAGPFGSTVGVYEELMRIAQQKELSFGEKSMLHTTEELLAQEIMLVADIDHNDALQVLRGPFKQFVINYGPNTTFNQTV